MAKVCVDPCERDNKFIEEYLTSEGFGKYICCCCCPALEKCKSLKDGIGCIRAFNGMYNHRSCINCELCLEENGQTLDIITEN